MNLSPPNPRKVFKIASLFFALVLLISVASLFYLYFTEKAVPPENLRVTNLTDQSVTLSWTTKKPTRGFVFFAPQDQSWKLKIPYLNRFLIRVSADDHLLKSDVHHASLKNLQPETEYHYLISTGLRTYKGGIAKTTAPPTSPSFPNPVYGKVLQKDSLTPAAKVIVYLTAKGDTTLSALTDEKGNWSLDLANLPPLTSATLELEAEGGSLGRAKKTISTEETQPVPLIILGPR